MKIIHEKPPGFYYFPDFITQEEEQLLINKISSFNWQEIKIYGVVAKRKVIHFGLNYMYESRNITQGDAIPNFLIPFINRIAQKLMLDADKIVEILITEYPIGSGIGWHKDSNVFGDKVFGISLNNNAVFKLRLKTADHYQVFKIELLRRSGYFLSEDARSIWQHSIAEVKNKRYSITFRTLRT